MFRPSAIQRAVAYSGPARVSVHDEEPAHKDRPLLGDLEAQPPAAELHISSTPSDRFILPGLGSLPLAIAEL